MEEWSFQLRIQLNEKAAKIIRESLKSKELEVFTDILRNHNASLKCQYDAFEEYVREAEEYGVEKYPLYKWTKATIENLNKKEKYLRSFTIYIDNQHVYSRDKADALENDLFSISSKEYILGIFKHDTNPANNPQVPERFRN
tara:strand:+ start:658 stop:1083 length:426 start_codon:yes stop_codon:yes gene_type:complete